MLKNTEFDEPEGDTVVFMPCFKKQVDVDLSCFRGIKLDSNSSIESAKMSMSIEIAQGLNNKYDLRDTNALDQGMKIEGEFVFVLYDDENDHLILATKVFRDEFMAYQGR